LKGLSKEEIEIAEEDRDSKEEDSRRRR